MDELESRLSDGLSRHAAGMPHYEGDLRRVTRRGRNRRWAARGAGAVGALALLGGGVVASQSLGDRGETVATEDPGEIIVPAAPTPTPTPEPTPATTPEPAPAATPETSTTPAPEQIRNVFAVSATGWGVGLVGAAGDFHTALTCCDGDDEDWTAQPVDAPARGAARVRDDLAGGLVASTVDTLWWQPANTLGAAGPIALDTVTPETAETDVQVDLWDVQLIEDRLRVLYSTASVDADGGLARLLVAEIVDDTPGEPEVLIERSWASGDGRGFVWSGAAWVTSGGHMELRSAVDFGCEWVVYSDDTDPSFESPFAPPTADGDCPQDSIGGATVNADGQLVVIERFLSLAPLTADLVVYDRVGNPLTVTPLPETVEGQPRWTEIDVVGSAVLVSRTTTPDLMTDEVLRVDIDAGTNVRPLPFVGNPTFARSDISTAALVLVEPGDARWFGSLDVVPDADPEPEATPDPEPTPEATPAAGPSPTPEPDATPEPKPAIPDDSRVPTGPGSEPKATGLIVGDDGCYLGLCLGMPADEALAAASLLGDPLEVDQTSEGESRFLVDGWDVAVLQEDGVVAAVVVRPVYSAPMPANPAFSIDGRPLTIGDLLRTLGAPATIGPGADAGVPLVLIEWETDAGFIAFGFSDTDPDDLRLADVDETQVPADYDDLVVNVYRARSSD